MDKSTHCLFYTPQYYIGGKHAVFIVEPAVSAASFCGMAYGLQTHTFARTLRGEEHAVFLPDISIAGIFQEVN